LTKRFSFDLFEGKLIPFIKQKMLKEVKGSLGMISMPGYQ